MATEEKQPIQAPTNEGAAAQKAPELSPGSSTSALGLESQAINEKALLRKLDVKLLPAVAILYLLSFLDRSNGTKSSVARPRIVVC